MKKILQIALDAEQKAQNIIAQAQIEKERCDKNIAQTYTIKDKYLEKAKQSVAEFEQQENSNTQKVLESLDKELSCSMENLESRFEASADEWVDTMYRGIIDMQ